MNAPAVCPIAVQKISNAGGGAFVGAPWRVVWHTTENSNIQAAYQELIDKHYEPHFLLDASNIWQLTPLDVAARALQHTGDPQTNRNNAIQIEQVGFAGRPKPPDLLASSRRLALWLAEAFSIPWVWPNGPAQPPVNGQDPGHHVRSVAAWAKGGHFEHSDVPENIHWDSGFTEAERAFLTAALPVPTTPPPLPSDTYVVVAGDTLYGISRRTGVPLATLATLNGISAPYVIRPGQVLKIR